MSSKSPSKYVSFHSHQLLQVTFRFEEINLTCDKIEKATGEQIEKEKHQNISPEGKKELPPCFRRLHASGHVTLLSVCDGILNRMYFSRIFWPDSYFGLQAFSVCVQSRKYLCEAGAHHQGDGLLCEDSRDLKIPWTRPRTTATGSKFAWS